MDEEKNIMKYVILFFDNSMNVSVHVYMSLETLNKIKKGDYKYPFIQYTDGKHKNKMYKCMQLKKAYQFYILVDEQNGF